MTLTHPRLQEICKKIYVWQIMNTRVYPDLQQFILAILWLQCYNGWKRVNGLYLFNVVNSKNYPKWSNKQRVNTYLSTDSLSSYSLMSLSYRRNSKCKFYSLWLRHGSNVWSTAFQTDAEEGLFSHFVNNHRICNKSETTAATSRTETTYHSVHILVGLRLLNLEFDI